MQFKFNTLLLLACSVLLPQAAAAMESGNYAAPDMTGYVLHRENEGDGNGDGVDETHIRHYVNPDGSTLFSMATTERLWAWSLSTPGEDTGIDNNYVIRDSNCDGVFDERYGLDEDFHIPDCLQPQTGILRPPGTPPVP